MEKVDEDEQYLSGRARRFVLGTTLMLDACETRLSIKYKRDLISVKTYGQFYGKTAVGLYYLFTALNLSTILLEWPGTILVGKKEIPYYVPLGINLVCEAYFYYRWFIINTVSEKEKFKDSLSTKFTLGILVLMSIDAVIYVLCQNIPGAVPVRWSRWLRPILLLTFPESRRIRSAFFNLRRTAVDVIPVFALYLSTIVFASIVAITILGNIELFYPDGKPYFPSFMDAFWELYVLATTANSPDVIIPAYENNRMFILLYIFVCTICNWLFMGILTASVYNSYKTHLGEFVVTNVAKRKKKLDEAFYLVSTPGPDEEPGVSQATFMRLMRIVKPRRSDDSLKVLFHILNKSRSGFLSLSEFGRLSEYAQAKLVEVELSRKYFQTFVPKFYDVFISSAFQTFKGLVEHDVTKYFFISLVIINGFTAILCRGYPSIQDAIEWFFTMIFLVELILNYLACGGVHFLDDGWNIFDCIVVFGALFGQILQASLESIGMIIPPGITQMLLLLRLLRLLKVFSAIPAFKVVISCIVTILPSLMAYTAILLILFYIFACFGMEVYGNRYESPPHHNYNNTDCYHSKLAGSSFVNYHYCLFTFNSVTESFIFLLILTVGNNWQIFAEGLVSISNTWTRLFFLVIHWSCVLLVLNVVLAFIIEAFLIEYDPHAMQFETYIRERLEEMGMHADTELAKRGIRNYNKTGFWISRSSLNMAFPPNSPRAKAFYLKSDTASIEILMFRMFEKEVDDLMENYRSSVIRPRLQAHDVYT